MPAADRPYVLARLTAWATWLLVGIPEVIDLVAHGTAGGVDWRWLAAYLAFGPTLYAPQSVRSRTWLQLLRLSVATLAPLVMVCLALGAKWGQFGVLARSLTDVDTEV